MATYYLWEDGTGWVDASTAGYTASPLTTKGDVWGYSTTDARIPVGADGDVLTADSTQALGVKWAAGGGGGVTSLDSITGAVSLVAGSNVTITDNSPSAGDITIASTGGSAAGLTQLYTTTLASAAATIDTGASGIASGHGDLVCTLTGRSSLAASPSDNVDMTFNGDTGNNYWWAWTRNLTGSLSAPASTSGANIAVAQITAASISESAAPGTTVFWIPAYDQTTYDKNGNSNGGWFGTHSGSKAYTTWFAAFSWFSTAAINQITLVTSTGSNFLAGTTFTVYGTQ